MLPSLEREMLQHIPVVSCPTMRPVEPGGSRDRTGDKVNTWPMLLTPHLCSPCA